MKTEVFNGRLPVKRATIILSPPKSTTAEDAAAILMLDTPENTPVGTPGSDITADELYDHSDVQSDVQSDEAHSSAEIARSAPQPIDIPRSRQPRRRNKKKRAESYCDDFTDVYRMTDEVLGHGAYATVQTVVELSTGIEFAAKIIQKSYDHPRDRVFREIELFHQCREHENIIQLVNFFEEHNRFLLIFEKARGGPLLKRIQERGNLTEHEASLVIKDLANALNFIHTKGIAHRDVKPENVLCVDSKEVVPVKLCDFDLGSGKVPGTADNQCRTPELLSPVGSAEFMAPEVVSGFIGECTKYDKRCDLWSLGVIMYILLCGYPPFSGRCGANCRWSQGGNCDDCQAMLFDSIKVGEYDFPAREWDAISSEAKDLINRLLVKDASLRYPASKVLKHPWVANGGPNAPLGTPSIIRLNDSAHHLGKFAGHANLILRSAMGESPILLAGPMAFASNSPAHSLSPLSDSFVYQRRRGTHSGRSLEDYGSKKSWSD